MQVNQYCFGVKYDFDRFLINSYFNLMAKTHIHTKRNKKKQCALHERYQMIRVECKCQDFIPFSMHIDPAKQVILYR